MSLAADADDFAAWERIYLAHKDRIEALNREDRIHELLAEAPGFEGEFNDVTPEQALNLIGIGTSPQPPPWSSPREIPVIIRLDPEVQWSSAKISEVRVSTQNLFEALEILSAFSAIRFEVTSEGILVRPLSTICTSMSTEEFDLPPGMFTSAKEWEDFLAAANVRFRESDTVFLDLEAGRAVVRTDFVTITTLRKHYLRRLQNGYRERLLPKTPS